ncbi:MAG: hypothetical protein AUG51_09455 [Acidobacteria bacterium 13_1_20CM_3_53_8]|nr:MAG: hypothetical protein AUG51_09455 [Acidobacteria bacterium 13_1_20CM_3_53_8]
MDRARPAITKENIMLKVDEPLDRKDLPEEFELDPVASVRIDRARGVIELIALEVDVVTPEGAPIGTVQRAGVICTLPLSSFIWTSLPDPKLGSIADAPDLCPECCHARPCQCPTPEQHNQPVPAVHR